MKSCDTPKSTTKILVLAPVPHHLAAIEKLLPQGSRAHPANTLPQSPNRSTKNTHLRTCTSWTGTLASLPTTFTFTILSAREAEERQAFKTTRNPKTLPSALNQPVLWQVCLANRSLPFGYALRECNKLTDEPRATCSTCWIVAPIYPKSNGKTWKAMSLQFNRSQ